jgi:ribosome-associated protein
MPPKRSTKQSAQDKALMLAKVALQRKPQNPLLIDVRKSCSFADYFLILSGTSIRQTQALSSHLEEALKKKGIVLRGIEGLESGQWILMDFDEVIVHIFFEPVREFYDLEGLWIEAPRIPISSVNTLSQEK